MACYQTNLFSESGWTYQLLRIRNPWGDEHEWNGQWSDHRISADDARLLGLQVQDDGEFWMCLGDFLANFQVVEICHQNFKNHNVQNFNGKNGWLD